MDKIKLVLLLSYVGWIVVKENESHKIGSFEGEKRRNDTQGERIRSEKKTGLPS